MKDYFSSIHDSRVYNLFIQLGYSKQLCVLFTKLCTLSHALPQGAPTSPYLSNLVTISLDDEIFKLCSSLEPNLRYSRYADDISISGAEFPKDLVKQLSKIIRSKSLYINYDKVHIIKNHNRQIVTGVVVNKKLQAAKDYRKKIRLEMYYINKFGINEHLNHTLKTNIDSIKYCDQLLGKVTFCLQLNKKDSEMQTYKELLLNLRSCQNQDFL